MSKRTRSGILTAFLILISAAVVLATTVAILEFTYSDRAQRDAERNQASAAEAYESDQEDVCLSLASPDEIANCVRQKNAATREQKQTQSDLHAQHDMAAFAHGLLWFSALSFITGAGGFVALVWTFSETRKMTRSQERAYVELTNIIVHTHGTYGARIYFRLSNCGRTPAKDITFTGHLRVNGETLKGTFDVSAELAVLPGETERDAAGRIPDFFGHFDSILGDYGQSGSHGRNTRTSFADPDGPPSPSIRLVGKIIWHSIYDDPDTIIVDDRAELQSDGNPLWIQKHYRDPKYER